MNIFMYHGDKIIPCGLVHPDLKVLGFLPVLRALTMIDPVTGWFEIKAILKPDARMVMDAFYEAWICCYPGPEQIGFDNGSKFKDVFSVTCKNYGINEKHSTSHNPQSNGIIEHIHQVVGNSL